MKYGYASRKRVAQPRWWRSVAALISLILVGGVSYFASQKFIGGTNPIDSKGGSSVLGVEEPTKPGNPLSDLNFYNDSSRNIVAVALEARRQGNTSQAELLELISTEPGTTWLNGPHASDPTAEADIATVERTSSEAKSSQTVPVYQLYALPKRDACAGYSAGGFDDYESYTTWLGKIKNALKTEAVFLVETDSIAQTIRSSCLSPMEVSRRYAFIKSIVEDLAGHSLVKAVYLDAGHPEWFPDPSVLVEPLKASGIDSARGVTVNVANFIGTAQVTEWSGRLVASLGGDKGVIIDTSRNGQGAPGAEVTGDARWCNPKDMGIGVRPTTAVAEAHVDAYVWVKNIGESDGDCFGNPPAGTFSLDLALGLARQANFNSRR